MGQLMFVPRLWQHATVNLGTALGFGGQAAVARKPRALAAIDADIATQPRCLDHHLEKASVLANTAAGGAGPIKALLGARTSHPRSLKLCTKMLLALGSVRSVRGAVAEAGYCDRVRATLRREGLLGWRQEGDVLAQWASALVESGVVGGGSGGGGGGGGEGAPAAGAAADAADAALLPLAAAWLEEALRRHAEDDFALFYLAAVRMMQGEFGAAERRLLRLLELQPGHDRARAGLDHVQEQLGRLDSEQQRSRERGREL